MCNVVCVPPHLLFVHPWLASLHTYEDPSFLRCVCLCVIVFHVHSLLFPPVLAELQHTDLITSGECRRLSDISDVVNVQRDKSPEVVSKTADVLGRNGLGKESILPAGRQSRPSSICLCYVVQWSLLSQCMGRSGCVWQLYSLSSV